MNIKMHLKCTCHEYNHCAFVKYYSPIMYVNVVVMYV